MAPLSAVPGGGLARQAGIGPGNRGLEIGTGTGKLTIDLAGSGCRITAVEPGPALARVDRPGGNAVARRQLPAHPSVKVVVADFERWELSAEPFDAVVCATAFHWIDPALRVVKAARALRPGGCLALVTTHHVAGGAQEFFERTRRCHERRDLAAPLSRRLVPGVRNDHGLPRVDRVTELRRGRGR
ncbi:class I SAM-dependent methyltransferase [Streptomyces sp. NPDC004752]